MTVFAVITMARYEITGEVYNATWRDRVYTTVRGWNDAWIMRARVAP